MVTFPLGMVSGCSNSWRYGEWGRDAVLHLAVRYGGYRLAEAVEKVPGLRYAAGAQGMTRFRDRLEKDKQMEQAMADIRKQLSKI